MDTLRQIEQQLSDILAATRSGSPTISAASASIAQVLSSIDSLQNQLRSAAHSIAATASTSQQNAVKNESNSVKHEFPCAETEEIEKSHGTEDNTRPPIGTLDPSAAAARLKQLSNSTKKFAGVVEQAANLDDQADDKQLTQVMNQVHTCSTSAVIFMVKFLQDGGTPTAAFATSFVDAVVMLPRVAERAQSQLTKTDKKWITKMVKNVEKILLYGKSYSHLPPALSGSELQNAHKALQEHSSANCSDLLQSMRSFANSMRSRNGALDPDNIAGPLGNLAKDFHRDIRLYKARQKSGKNPPRSEERWALFTEICEVLTQWTHQAELASVPPKVPGTLSKFERQLKGFSYEFPGRVPDELLKASAIMSKFARGKGPAPKKNA